MHRYATALIREMEQRRATWTFPVVDTLYVGGGTPSCLPPDLLQKILQAVVMRYPLAEDAEVTVEANPDDVTPAWLDAVAGTPVNRISMGVQTFDDAMLAMLHRRHDSQQAVRAVDACREAGLENISIDLIYGLPGQTLAMWESDVRRALALQVTHLSAYALTYEDGTPLARMRDNNKVAEADEELSLAMYRLLCRLSAEAGMQHYEISNFAKPGFRSRHNSSYWQDVPYIGLGAAAHSYSIPNNMVLGGSAAKSAPVRSWNVSDIHAYIAAIERGERPCDEEVLDEDTHYNDRITTALRTSDGLDLTTLSDRHRTFCMKEAQRFLNDGLLRLDDNRLILTRKGLFVSDMVMSSLMLV